MSRSVKIQSSETQIEVYEFGDGIFNKHHITHTEEIKPFLEVNHKFWLNLYGLENDILLKEIGEIFEIHPLTLEDIKNTSQRPKFEEFEENIFIVSKMIYYKNKSHEPITEQISILFGKNYIISIQENPFDIFDPIRSRLENPTGKMRKLGTDYFAYTLLDTIVDKYFDCLEHAVEKIETLEDHIISQSKNTKLPDIFHQRKTIQQIKRTVWPTRELLSAWKKSESPLVKKKTNPFINDVYEHVIEIIENLEIQRESISALVELFMSNLSLKQNEVMKTLTIIATIFIPLTFIAGVYGMNFEFMPELGWKYGYLVIWIFFLGSTLGMMYYFKKKKWF
ncbi:magnesium/cobalt transporter CorA [Aquiflexum sp. TKW24L]|uniref:magnesium/cobalt transporter CorA n=1 Tax=Aquiflexum sp. TKW24L TaxID=2942212 RepID=UPI0020C0D3D4|nr:magnesium/cobalt transporter CorA [Aquiflexum sp. TKW24L]MCL6259661.1 magnesium/cobalt transporter CorA [Aquiflexum sp. TKW24L]